MDLKTVKTKMRINHITKNPHISRHSTASKSNSIALAFYRIALIPIQNSTPKHIIQNDRISI